MRTTTTARKLAPMVLLTVLLVGALSPAAVPSQVGAPDPSVIDPKLGEAMATAPADEPLQVIIQFEGSITEADRYLLQVEGVESLHEFSIVPGVWAKATPQQITRISGYPRTFWVELNEPLVYYMDETTTVINATKTWDSRIEGSLWGATGAIDGKGVTAVVLDTGVDAGHPDLDYGSKCILNLKSDTGVGPWYEVQNSDTSSGHGTHCAGTVLGNGDASNGARRGVAPGANLIALSTGEAGAIINALGGLEWVYEHSKIGNNPYNIRVVSNSWGAGGGNYSPSDSISQAIDKLVYENNVAVCFAAGNSGGTGDDIQTSNYGNTPAAICVAASGRDGTYITDFSSKGQWDLIDTWPDIAAPGHHIQSTAARRTQISIMTRDPSANPYYLAISGTSMATPHVAGTVALLWQACPSMRVSNVSQDWGMVENNNGVYSIKPPDTPSDLPFAGYPIHESELILKLTADYIPAQGTAQEGMNGQTQNYVTDWSLPGDAASRQHDFCQGYGLINVNRAVGLALALERIRWDYPEATVLDAYSVFEGIFEHKEVSMPTDQVMTSWGGEWSRFNQLNSFNQNLTKFVYVPAGADSMTVSMNYPPVSVGDRQLNVLWFMIDQNGDGSWDYTSSRTPSTTGSRTETVPISGSTGTYWKFGLGGNSGKIPDIIGGDHQYKEARIEFEMSVSIHFPSGTGDIVINELDLHAVNGHLRFAEPSTTYAGGNVTVMMWVYDLYNVSWSPNPPLPPVVLTKGHPLLWAILLLVIVVAALYVIARTQPESKVGRAVRRVAAAVGVVALLAYVRRLVTRLTARRSKAATKG